METPKILAPQVKQRLFHAGETLANLLILNGLLKIVDCTDNWPD
jgi:hypothetical protein